MPEEAPSNASGKPRKIPTEILVALFSLEVLVATEEGMTSETVSWLRLSASQPEYLALEGGLGASRPAPAG